ncbi:MAG: polymer-forming cytoskeletal protein [Halobellus sp.]|uniref:polymer-forming cytoskeletal protein n=1 Tax=Halobellus sp. TaxID=1979212 RepID=UPI0035D52A76
MSNLHPYLTVLLAALVVLGGVPALASAQSVSPGGPGGDGSFGGVVRVDAGETRQGPLEAAAGSVIIAGTVEGDVEAAAGSVLVTDTGRVTGSVDAAAGSVIVEGVVEGDVTAGSAAFELREGARIGGALEAGSADVRLDGTVDGDATVSAETFAVGPNASIGGSLTYDAATATIAGGATVAGEVIRDENLSLAGPDVFGSGGGGGASLPTIPAWVGPLYGALTNLLLGGVLLLAAPAFSRRVVSESTTRTLRSLGIGLLALIATPIALLILLITIVGIPLSLAGFLVFGLLLWVASVYGAVALGSWMLSLADYTNRWVALLVGVVVVTVLAAIPIVRSLVQFAVVLLGLGACVAAVRDVRGDDGDSDGVTTAEPTTIE